jgi:hypothetical protein
MDVYRKELDYAVLSKLIDVSLLCDLINSLSFLCLLGHQWPSDSQIIHKTGML